MTVKPYPSNTIIFDVDDRVLDEEMKLALRRSWTHIGEILVRSHTGSEDDKPQSSIRVMVKYGTRPYLKSDGADADANWTERLEPYLKSTIRKIGSNTIAFNRRQRKTGDSEFVPDTLEFVLEGGSLVLEYRLPSNGNLPVSCASIATNVREALNAGVLGEPARIRIPSVRSYELQAARYAQAKAEAEAREAGGPAVEAETAAMPETVAEVEPAEDELAFIESPELVEAVEEEEAAAAKTDSPFEITPLSEEEWEAEYGDIEADFEIDYSLWDAVFADGTAREFDPSTNQFLS